MKITALLLLRTAGDYSSSSGPSDPVVLANASDVGHFGYFQRTVAKEFILFVARTVAKRTPPGQRQSVQHEEYKVHSYNRNGLCALAFMDDHYPVRSAFSLLNKVLDEYQNTFGDSWRIQHTDSNQPWPYLTEALTKFQDPAEVDKLLKIQRDLDETKILLTKRRWKFRFYSSKGDLRTNRKLIGNLLIVYRPYTDQLTLIYLKSIQHKTIDSVLARGEKLDSLVEKSSDLSAASQMFYKQARKTNQCCTLL